MKNSLSSKSVTLRSGVALAVLPLCLAVAGRAHAAALIVVTPGEQNTKSGENGCGTAPCNAGVCPACTGGNWLHYPEILSNMLGKGYTVSNNGDGGAVLGCDAASATAAGGDSFCKSGVYNTSISPAPDIVIIGPFGEHDQRIIAGNAANMTNLYKPSAFEAAYEGLVQRYLTAKPTVKIYMMTPIDITFNAGNLPAGDDIVKDVMLAASKKVAGDHGIPIIDTNAMVGMSYYSGDGQVNSAGQQKMATMILAALMAGGGADGGATDGGGSGAGGAGGAKADGGAAGAGAAGTTAGTAGTTATTAGTAGTTATTAGTAGTTASTTGAAGTTASTTGAAGTTASTTGAAGTTTTGAAGTTTAPRSSSGGGCAYATPAGRGALGLGAATMLVGLALVRRRARRR